MNLWNILLQYFFERFKYLLLENMYKLKELPKNMGSSRIWLVLFRITNLMGNFYRKNRFLWKKNVWKVDYQWVRENIRKTEGRWRDCCSGGSPGGLTAIMFSFSHKCGGAEPVWSTNWNRKRETERLWEEKMAFWGLSWNLPVMSPFLMTSWCTPA